MECTTCGGKDEKCKTCGGWGHIKITGCPKEEIDNPTLRLIELAEFAEKGAFPVSGGVLDQSAGFMRGARMVWNETEYWKAKFRIT